MRVAVIGGGISGLSSAFLIKKGLKDVEVDVFEAGDSPGGTIKTVQKDGYTLEFGPNGFLSGKRSTLEIARLCQANGYLVEASEDAEKRYVLKNGKLVPLPDSPVSFFKSSLLSLKGKIEIMKEPFVKPLNDDYEETVGEFGQRRLGKEAVDYLLDPMVSGVFAGSVDRLSLKQCFPRIWQLEREYGSLVKAMFKLKSKKASPSGRLTSFKQGMEYLIKSLVNKGDFCVHTGKKVSHVEKRGKRFLLNTSKEEYRAVVFAVPSYAYMDIAFPLKERVIEGLMSIKYPPMAVICLSLESKIDVAGGFGFLIPSIEKRRILGALYSSNIFPNRAPDNRILATVMMGGDNNGWIMDFKEEELMLVAIEELSEILSIKKKYIEPVAMRKIRRAIPQYYKGHGKIVESLEELSRQIKGLFFTGNAFYGIGINDCTARAFSLADSVIDFLKGNHA